MTDTPRHGDRAALEADELSAPRLAKADARAAEPTPHRFERTATAAELHDRYEDLGPAAATGELVVVAGRLVGWRDLGRLVFAPLQDGTGRIQLFADAEAMGEDFTDLADLDVGDWVGVSGEVVTTKKGELSVKVADIVLLTKSLRPLPDKWHGLTDTEARYRRRYLDLIVSEDARRTMHIRAEAVRRLRSAFWNRGFVEVETPALELQPTGALARPFVTHHNALDVDMYLRIAMELPLKKLVVGGVEQVFELGRTFRNEGVSTRYNPDFTMLEAYQAFADYNDFMVLVEEVVAEVAQAVVGSTEVVYQGKPIDLTPPWRRVRFLDALAEHAGEGLTLEAAPAELVARAAAHGITVEGAPGSGAILAAIFDKVVEPRLVEPTFVIDYPKSISPFSRDHPDRPGLVERFEVFVAGWEIGNAYSELTDPIEQRRRFTEQAIRRAEGDPEAHPIDESYLEALEYGLPPTAGLGIGVDRLVMLLADKASIREVILFPAMRPE